MNALQNLPIRSPFIKLLSYVSKIVIKSQAGIAPILVLFLLVVGIAGGTYLVQQRTNILPQAAEASFQCSASGSAGVVKYGVTIPCKVGVCDGIQTAIVTSPCNTPNCISTCSWSACQKKDQSCGNTSGTTQSVRTCKDGKVVDRTTDEFGQSYYQDVAGGDCSSQGLHCSNGACINSPTNTNITRCVSNGVRNQNGQSIDNCNNGRICKPMNSSESRCHPPQNDADCVNTYGTEFSKSRNTGLCERASAPLNPVNPGEQGQTTPLLQRTNCTGEEKKEYDCKNGFRCFHVFKKALNADSTGCEWVPDDPRYTCVPDSQCGQKPAGAAEPPAPPRQPVRAAPVNSGSSSNPNSTQSAPSDPASCKESTVKTCIYSQAANECYLGICKGNDCSFNSPDCSFQNAIDKSCVNTTYSHSNGGYSVSGTPGSKVNCPSTPAQGGSSGSTTSATQGSGQQGTGATPTPTPIPLTTREQVYEKCGFIPKAGINIPLFAVGLGENQEINDETCKKLQKEQLDQFNSYLAKARAEEAELRKRAEEARKAGDTAKAEELTKSADELKKKTEEAAKKTEECKGKEGQAGIDCLKAAQEPVKKVATEAQSLAVKNALAKYEKIIKGEIKGGCVKADLGITPYLEAQRLKRRSANDEQRRVLLCAGDKDPKQLKWRVLVGGKSSTEATNEAEAKKLTSDDGDDVDEGNNAERIWGLHGESKDATGDPKYPYTTQGKNPVTFENPNTEAGRNVTMGKYIEAAKAGKNTLRSAPVPGDDGVEAPCSKGATNCGQTGGGGGGQQPGGGGGSSECTQSEKDRCAKEGSDYVCTKPNGQYNCAVADKCKEDKDCAGKPEGKTECHRSSGQCVKPKEQSGGGSGDECQDTNQCLAKNGDGWICNSSKKCENEGGDSCTNDNYCVNKYDNVRYWCKSNKCTNELKMPGSPVFTPLQNFFQSLF